MYKLFFLYWRCIGYCELDWFVGNDYLVRFGLCWCVGIKWIGIGFVNGVLW